MTAMRRRPLREVLLPAAVLLVVVTAVAAALLLSGSPAEERRRWADSLRTQDLQALDRTIEGYYEDEKRLPTSLAVLKRRDASLRTADVRSGEPYAYRPLNGKTYELCATFETDTSNERDPSAARSQRGGWIDPTEPFWRHASGRECFRLEVEGDGEPQR